MKRIFVAITLSQQLKNIILDWQKSHSNLPVRWIAAKNLHITLVPPWQEENIDRVIKKLSQISFPKFQLNFHTISLGPNARNPQLIWMLGEDNKVIDNLRIAIHKELQIHIDPRSFKIHTTLARFKTEDFNKFPSQNLRESINWNETVSSFVLMESNLSLSGADYTILAKWELM